VQTILIGAAMLGVASGDLAQASTTQVESPSAEKPADAGFGARTGAAIDQAAEDLAAWARRVRAASGETTSVMADEVKRATKDWYRRARVGLLGDPDASASRAVRIVRRLAPVPLNARVDGFIGSEPVYYDWIPVDALIERERKMPERVIVLLHGLDEPGTGWDDLVPHLLRAGYEVVAIDYANDAGLAGEAEFVGRTLGELKRAGVRRIDIVAHSMGGLIGRDVLTRPTMYTGAGRGHEALPDVGRFIIMSTPNAGSVLAPLECIAEVREHLSRKIDDLELPGDGLIASAGDGCGEAAKDLLPGSAYLTELNARALPADVRITNIIATLMPESRVEKLAGELDALVREVGLDVKIDSRPALKWVSTHVGDGLVSLESGRLAGVEDTVYVNADHRSMVRLWTMLPRASEPVLSTPEETPAIPTILERLARPETPE
jgi:pimeloyl-ACP methyl ester carboxylesterase